MWATRRVVQALREQSGISPPRQFAASSGNASRFESAEVSMASASPFVLASSAGEGTGPAGAGAFTDLSGPDRPEPLSR